MKPLNGCQILGLSLVLCKTPKKFKQKHNKRFLIIAIVQFKKLFSIWSLNHMLATPGITLRWFLYPGIFAYWFRANKQALKRIKAWIGWH